MRTVFAILAISIALCLWLYLAVSWGPVILQQGLEAALTEQSSQPPFLVTATCLLVGAVSSLVGISLAFTRKGD